MKPIESRQAVLIIAAVAVVVGSSLVSEPAFATAKALFRVERSWFGAPFPAATIPGGAGRYQGYLEPYTSYPAAEATVQGGNVNGEPFKLPQSFISYQGTFTYTAKTGFPGYTSISAFDYANGEARFGPNVGASGPTRLVFPTTMGNPVPNYGSGNPVTPTTTFGGRYDFSRAGTINVTPGPNRFAGTMRLLYRPASSFYQYIYYFAPAYYKAYGSFKCERAGVNCNYLDTEIGETTTSGMVTRFLLNVKGTGTGNQNNSNTAKATTPTNGGFITAKNYYLHKIHPWTTGFVSVYNYLSTFQITPQLQGYDKTLGGTDITVTHQGTSAMFNPDLSTVTYTYPTYKQYLSSVMRVVSLVRPRLVQVYQKPIDPSNPIISNFQAARVWTMKVYFVPEPAALVMMGAGIAGLLGLSRIRRR
ncbi:MAG: PEP-CTERM sorting domain-containing protein [Deltaproteobacteria bacterium]|nr:PEP-CTERM sorting domain-containing protein [Deltaproteobacteria bacterium]